MPKSLTLIIVLCTTLYVSGIVRSKKDTHNYELYSTDCEVVLLLLYVHMYIRLAEVHCHSRVMVRQGSPL